MSLSLSFLWHWGGLSLHPDNQTVIPHPSLYTSSLSVSLSLSLYFLWLWRGSSLHPAAYQTVIPRPKPSRQESEKSICNFTVWYSRHKRRQNQNWPRKKTLCFLWRGSSFHQAYQTVIPRPHPSPPALELGLAGIGEINLQLHLHCSNSLELNQLIENRPNW